MTPRIRFAVLLALATTTAGAQQAEKRVARGWEFVGLPALNFSSDEGFGYGVLAEIYNYGDGIQPYRFTIQPTIFLTTKGRRDFVVFFDAPKVLPNNWRLDAFVGSEEQLAQPYYGIGNATMRDTNLSKPPNPYFYSYGRRQVRILGNLQHPIGSSHARVLAGLGFTHVQTHSTPFDSGTTLFRAEQGSGQNASFEYGRAGVVWDTRDREVGPRSGTWADVLVQRAIQSGGGFTRLTGTARGYRSLTERLVFAQRLLVQQTSSGVPIWDLSTVQTSFKQQEGLGGSNTVRGLLKNRFMGRGMVVSNSELRWRFVDFSVMKKPTYLLLSGFFDVGRVWADNIKLSEIASGLHSGYGGGLRVGLGPSFVVAFDLGKSSESTQIYLGLGYPF